jgi:hypothetical protein
LVSAASISSIERPFVSIPISQDAPAGQRRPGQPHPARLREAGHADECGAARIFEQLPPRGVFHFGKDGWQRDLPRVDLQGPRDRPACLLALSSEYQPARRFRDPGPDQEGQQGRQQAKQE